MHQTLADANRDRTLRGSLECVAAVGYDAATVQGIIVRAGVTREGFYRRHTSKAECFREALTAAEAALWLELEAAQPGAPDREGRMRALTQAGLRWLAQDPDAARCLVLEADRPEVADAQALRERRTRMTAWAARVLDVDDPFAVRSMVATVRGIIREEVLEGRTAGLPELADELVQHAARLLHPVPIR